MDKTKVTLSLDMGTWKSFKLHCVKNDLIASDLVNDCMTPAVGRKPRKIFYDLKIKKHY